jgi:hypothetical protein
MPLGTQWRPFTKDVVDLTPEVPGAYELGYAKSNTVVYIGSSEASIRSRLRSHRKRSRFMKVTHFRFRKTASDEARNLEVRLCKAFLKEHRKPPRLQDRMPREVKSFIDKLLHG